MESMDVILIFLKNLDYLWKQRNLCNLQKCLSTQFNYVNIQYVSKGLPDSLTIKFQVKTFCPKLKMWDIHVTYLSYYIGGKLGKIYDLQKTRSLKWSTTPKQFVGIPEEFFLDIWPFCSMLSYRVNFVLLFVRLHNLHF